MGQITIVRHEKNSENFDAKTNYNSNFMLILSKIRKTVKLMKYKIHFVNFSQRNEFNSKN
ncbi:hypothetical protein DB895_06705 [Flavobacterium psychrotolerans]|uniref:Uncharacterized protein n=1 Tax=Flavobacterium psychrotolerans TaxID=2169410 RepID=A0A2U1JKY5_9FLAO|nr:hypothetical protein DB895_06705 [Flavobacterium psychrotolerans]